MKTIPEISKETLAIENYVKDLPEGYLLTYTEVGEKCSVKMDNKGKSYLRTAFNRLKIEVSCIPSIGYRLADIETAPDIMLNKMVKIDKSVLRGEKTHKRITRQFSDRFDDEVQRHMLFLGGVFGSIRVAAQAGKKLLRQKSGQDKLKA